VGFLMRLLDVAGEASGTTGFGHGRTVRLGVPEVKLRCLEMRTQRGVV
jgi:hypothetical protein